MNPPQGRWHPAWSTHLLLPGLAGLALVGLQHLAGWDLAVVDAFYDPAARAWEFGADSIAFRVLYPGGRGIVFATAALCLAALLGPWRRPAAYLLLCIALTTGLAGLGKQATNVDCPKDLQRYGGTHPDIGWFADRPDDLPRARCFPGGHSSGGFSFLALYFLLGDRHRRWRWAGLGAGLALGFSFAAVQWGRGQHFPSHDLVSAMMGWTVALGAYTLVFQRSLWTGHAPAAD